MKDTNIKSTVNKLYEFITKMVFLLENDLDHISHDDQDLKFKKDITFIVSKMVSLIIQLNKLSKDENLFLETSLPEEDLEIIARFVSKYEVNDLSRNINIEQFSFTRD